MTHFHNKMIFVRYCISDSQQNNFKIKKWIVYGGSWGGSLTLFYGIKHPKRCLALVPCSLSLFDGYNEESFITMAPELHHQWKIDHALNDKQNMKLYLKFLRSDRRSTRTKYTKKWNRSEGSLFKLMKFSKNKFKLTASEAYTVALFECYYYYHRAFIKGDLLKQIKTRLKKVPGHIIHGRFDLICSPRNAYLAHKHWKKSTLYFAEMSGHSGGDEEMKKITLRVFNRLAKQFSGLCKK